MIEYEAKILNIDPADAERRILAARGTKIAERHMRRNVYDVVPPSPSRWVRLRDNGTEITLAAKHVRDEGAIDGTDEVEVIVDDFDRAHQLLVMQGLTAKASQENRRTSYTIEGVAVEADRWPGIPPLLEIEASSADEVARTAGLLGYTEDQLTGDSIVKIYHRYGIDLLAHSELCFAAFEASEK